MNRTRSLIIAAAVLVVLGAVLAVVLLVIPEKNEKENPQNSDISMSDVLDFLGEDGEQITVLTDQSADSVLKLSVSNKNGGYTFNRVKNGEEYRWATDALGDVSPDDDAIRRFVGCLSMLSGTVPVEENVSGVALDKYGLKDPAAKAELSFEDGTSAVLSFGIRNPSQTGYVYCTKGDGVVIQVDYQAVINVFSDARPFADLVMTEERSVSGQPEYVRIERVDLDTPVEIRYMSELDAAAKDESIVVTTLNTYRFVEPIRAEVDASGASGLYDGVCGLEMNRCEFLEKSEENLKRCGLDTPFARVEFKYNGKVRVLLLGNEFTLTTQTSSVQCYYAVMEDVPGIFSLQKNKARWATFSIFGSVSNRPVSPYIYSCENVVITTPDGEFKFDIDGVEKTFSIGGKKVDGTGFRKLYQKLIDSVGDELFTEPVEGEPVVKVRFNYKNEYSAVYGGLSDELCYYKLDGRRYAVTLNGNTLFKVNAVYVDGLVTSVNELVNK